MSFRENGKAIREFNVAFFTASCDDAETNRRFAESLELDYPILSDPEKSVARAYGVVTIDRQVPFRWTFIIGADGNILYIDRNVNAATHGRDIAQMLEEFGITKSEE